ncbi:hypothetical protein F4859DRAFT_524123 [Xylaria cf. heliscus]|nr:hypothetical protein F4859DRAFT_524123 [Xylaria cf. heliscus]
MPYRVLIFAYRKPGTTPGQFKTHYERNHIPLNQFVGNTARNPSTPATVLIGTQDYFDYDAFTELIFENEAAFQSLFRLMQRPGNAERIVADEEKFLDRTRMPVVVLGDTTDTRRQENSD